MLSAVVGIVAIARVASASPVTYTYAGQPLISGFTGNFDGTGYLSGFITLDYIGPGTYTTLIDWSMTYNQGDHSFTLNSANSHTTSNESEFVTDASGEFFTRWILEVWGDADPSQVIFTYFPALATRPDYAKEIVNMDQTFAINTENSPNRPTLSNWTRAPINTQNRAH